jgi:beta-phosphoglucomutase-like phosphatase (HAD superfamily)
LLGVQPADSLVIDDAPAGVEAGVAAGMTVVAVTTTNESDLQSADAIVHDLHALLLGRSRVSRPETEAVRARRASTAGASAR